MLSINRRLIRCSVATGAAVMAVAALPSIASADTTVCHGTPQSPGVLSGNYSGDVRVEGVCAVNNGPATIAGKLELAPEAALIAAFGRENSHLTVQGNVVLDRRATLFLGCNPQSSPCIDDNPNEPKLTSHGFIGGNLIARDALAAILHSVTINGNVRQTGGGGGVNCNPTGVFNLFGSPVFSTYEDGEIRGNVSIKNMHSCWLGFNRVKVGGNVRFVGNQLADPDAIEILGNNIAGDLVCRDNSMVWDSFDLGEKLYPRERSLNTVGGKRVGQCVLASPVTDRGVYGPEPF